MEAKSFIQVVVTLLIDRGREVNHVCLSTWAIGILLIGQRPVIEEHKGLLTLISYISNKAINEGIVSNYLEETLHLSQVYYEKSSGNGLWESLRKR